jgi:hypothetical protein
MTTWVCPTCEGSRFVQEDAEAGRFWRPWADVPNPMPKRPCPDCGPVLALMEAAREYGEAADDWFRYASSPDHFASAHDLLVLARKKLDDATAPFAAPSPKRGA